ncbi:MAG: hypothetical protein JXA25_05955 [Anaerolineales bacterium]|nr:hypothetical protein [Anaerolineales bacterium]
MSWMDQLNGDSVSWLLEQKDPGVRYLARRDLLDLPPDNSELAANRETAHREGPIADVLKAMQPEGFWERPGAGYNPKYRSTVWAVILLAQLGAMADCDIRIHRACSYLLDFALTDHGQFTATGSPSGTIDCLQGNLCWALLEMGYKDPRISKALEWMARSVTGEGIAPKEEKDAPVRYYAYQCGPLFACGPNLKQSCAWGAVKVMLAFGRVPQNQRTPLMDRAVQAGADFLLGTDPAEAAYPTGGPEKPNRSWWTFGFPVFYVTDVLQNVEALVSNGFGSDPRLRNAVRLIHDKQDSDGRWLLEYSYKGKTWGDYGEKKTPNPYVTLRACRVLKHTAQS